MSAPTLREKPHYPILDGLRGVAALLVVAFHLLEAHSTGHQTQLINHGYLAVDFFFLLSGYVIGYAYDDRWGRMSLGSFVKRRLVRLQPMVVLGMVIGALTFYFQTTSVWPLIDQTPVWKVLLYTVLGSLMIPMRPAFDIRGWQENYPLNGPAWSLFYEYVANLLYAVLVRRFSRLALAVLVALAGAVLLQFALTVPSGDMAGGWSLNIEQTRVGLTRLMYPFFAGLLLYRMARPGQVPGAFWWSAGLVVLVLALPRMGGPAQPWLNGLYEALCILLVFPLAVYLGTCGGEMGRVEQRLCSWLGAISYPIYITHYPLVYLYTAWVYNHKVPVSEGLPWAALTFAAAVALAYASLRLYDEPVRRWLGRQLLPGQPPTQPTATAAPTQALIN